MTAVADPEGLGRAGDAARVAMELDRLARLQAQLVAHGCDAGLFYDPNNIRYATGTSNMDVYVLHVPCRYAFVPAEGRVTLFDFKACEHLSESHPAVGEAREAVSWFHFFTGSRTEEYAHRWAAEIAGLLGANRSPGHGPKRLAVDRLDPYGLRALERHGVEVVDGGEVANLARVIKSGAEIEAMRAALAACERAIGAMEAALEPPITEQELWAVMHHTAIAEGGGWFETRLLSSGPRTNPWFQECSNRVISDGDLVAFVEPDFIGRGYGRKLMMHAQQEARHLGYSKMIIQGDPNAERFYRSAGGLLVSTRKSASIPNRELPIFCINLRESDENLLG